MFGVSELFLHSFTMQYLILVEMIRSWCNRRSFVYVFRKASATVYCTVKQLTNDRRAENLCQAPVTGLYRDVHHDSPR